MPPGQVRTIDTGHEPERREPGRSAPIALAASVALLGWVLLTVASTPPSAPFADDAELIREATVAGPMTEPDRAVGVVKSFELAFNADDPAAATDLIAPNWTWLEIPGTVGDAFWPDERGRATDAVRFGAMVADLSVDDCSATPSRGEATADFVVRCAAVSVTGTYPQAIGRYGDSQSLIFGVADDLITSIVWGGHSGDRYDTTAYCEFALDESAAAAQEAFDADCRPEEGEAALPFHRNLSALYVAVGRPSPDRAQMESEYALRTVSGLFAALDAGKPFRHYIESGLVLIEFPGMMRDPNVSGVSPTPDLLRWIGVVYDVDLGDCSVAPWDAGQMVVKCPEATWSGPLVRVLGLESVVQPVAFLVDDFLITSVEGETDPGLQAAFLDLCASLRRDAPVPSQWAFAEGCSPDLTETGATALLTAAEGLAASPSG